MRAPRSARPGYRGRPDMTWGKRGNKFGAIAVVSDGERFASKAEFKRYCTLRVEQMAGLIFGLELHPRFRLDVNGQHICDYIADFGYVRKGAVARTIEDSKSLPTLTPECKLKLKLMKACHGIDVLLTGAIAKKRQPKMRAA